jgi:hypothetical protein
LTANLMESNAALLVIHWVTHMSARAIILSRMTCAQRMRQHICTQNKKRLFLLDIRRHLRGKRGGRRARENATHIIGAERQRLVAVERPQ